MEPNSMLNFSDFEGVFVIGDNEVLINWNIPGVVSLVVGLFLLIVFSFAYFINLNRHNKHNPHNQLSAFTLKLGEFINSPTEDSHFKEYEGQGPMSKCEMNVGRRSLKLFFQNKSNTIKLEHTF